MKNKYWAALVAIFLFLTGAVSAAYIVNNPFNVTVLKDGNPEPGILVQFILNGGTPILTTTDSQGKVRFVPLATGNLIIKASTINGVSLADPISVSVTAGNDKDADLIIALSGSPIPAATSGSTPPSAGTAGDGGNVTTSEPFDNIEKSEQYDKNLPANTPVTYNFALPGIYEIVVTGIVDEYDVSLRVEALKGQSKLAASPAPGTVYKNMNIWPGTKRIKDVLVRFKVENAWLTENNLAGSDIKLVKYDGSKWIQLETSEKKKDSTHTYFEAKTDSFSRFAITGIKAPASAAPVSVVTPPEREETKATARPGGSVPGFEAIMGMAAFLALYIFFVIIHYMKLKE